MEALAPEAPERAELHATARARPDLRRTRRIFFAGLGLVYASAFVSLWVQVHGLFGAQGIRPTAAWLERVHAALGSAAYREVPSLLWLGAGDRALDLVCALGTGAGVALALGLVPPLAAASAWVLWLSLVVAGSPFLSFQWDVLLLEAGLIAIPLAPLGLGPGAFRRRVSPALWFLLRWLLFRLMLLSGLVKVLSQDPTWRDGSALSYHWWTQPLPHVLAWYAARLPLAADRVLVRVTLAIELGLPLLALGPRLLRRVAFAGFATLMVAIAGTGNYGFFNLLTLVLCLALLDDRFLARVLPRRARPEAPEPLPRRGAPVRKILAGLFAALVLALSSDATLRYLSRFPGGPDVRAPLGPLEPLAEALAPLRCFNGYGLFASMTASRLEITVEGSRDGVTWEPYVFRWKPGPLERAPRFAAVHMPRLDWQMWFAALGSWEGTPWFAAFEERLLEGSPAVLDLLERDPFGGDPPRFVRAESAPYRFSTPAERRASGRWWERGESRPYGPTLTLEGGRLAPVR